jgi:hypothetical protein
LSVGPRSFRRATGCSPAFERKGKRTPPRYKFGKKVVYVTKSGRELDETTVKTRIKIGIPIHVHYTTQGDDMLVDRVTLRRGLIGGCSPWLGSRAGFLTQGAERRRDGFGSEARKNNEWDIQIRGSADISVKPTYRRYL